jgi:alpha-1,2-glucosyltransferase
MDPWLDETSHIPQIGFFYHGRYKHQPTLTTFETYHWIVAQIARVLNTLVHTRLRVISTALSLPLAFVAFAWGRKLHQSNFAGFARGVQILLLPISVAYMFLLYTDSFALEAILLAACLNGFRQYFLAALLGILCVGVRQTNVFWLVWLLVSYAYQEGLATQLRAGIWLAIRRHGLRLLPYLVGFVLFGVFVLVNHGVAMGDRSHHPAFKFGLGNVLVALFASAVVLLPLHIAQAADVVRMIRRYPIRVAVVALPLAAWFAFGFVVDHEYNLSGGFVHNEVALWLNQPWHRAYVVFPTVWAGLSMYVAIEKRGTAIIWSGMSVLTLLPVWMIEHRYYIVPFALWLCLRKSRHWSAEWATMLWFAAWGAAAVYLVRHGPWLL